MQGQETTVIWREIIISQSTSLPVRTPAETKGTNAGDEVVREPVRSCFFVFYEITLEDFKRWFGFPHTEPLQSHVITSLPMSFRRPFSLLSVEKHSGAQRTCSRSSW